MTPEQLAALPEEWRRLAQKITPGEWHHDQAAGGYSTIRDERGDIVMATAYPSLALGDKARPEEECCANLAAMTAVPRLLRELAEMLEQRDFARQEAAKVLGLACERDELKAALATCRAKTEGKDATEQPKPKLRRMQGVRCSNRDVAPGVCPHETEHEEITENSRPEPYYQDTCGYHECKPVEVASKRMISQDEFLRAFKEEFADADGSRLPLATS
jgi:hypothetical protein